MDNYLDLITSEYRNSPNFISWLDSALSIVNSSKLTTDQINAAFDIDYAVGAQLDILGELIGRTRALTFQPSDGSNPILDDDTYRLMLKAKISQNQWDGTIPAVYDLWNNIFPFLYMEVYDNQDMTMEVIIVGIPTLLQKELVLNGYIVPKPEGVRVNYNVISKPIFAYALDTPALAGYDKGTWYQTKPLFAYDTETEEYQGYEKGVWT